MRVLPPFCYFPFKYNEFPNGPPANSFHLCLCSLKCEFLGIDIQDDMGRHEVGFVENTIKTPIGIDQSGCLFEARFHINKVRDC